MPSADENIFALHRAGVAFLLIDLDLAMTFLDIADTSRSAETVCRNRQHARTAYESVSVLLPHLTLTADEWQRIQEKLSAVDIRLEAAKGELDGAHQRI